MSVGCDWTSITVTSNETVQELSVPCPRAGHSICYDKTSNSCVLFGGANHEQGMLNDMYTLDMDSFTWIRLKDATIPARYEHVAFITERNNQSEMIVMYGAGTDHPLDDVWSFNMVTRTWTALETKSAPSPRVVRSVGVDAGRVYMFGGGLYNNVPVDDTAMHCLDLKSLRWFRLAQDGPSARLGHTLSVVGKQIFVIGGISGDRVFDAVEIFDIETRKWSVAQTTGDFPGRCAHSALVRGTKIYVYGGMDMTQVFDSLYSLDTKTMKWTLHDGFNPGARLDHDMVVADKCMVLFGGMDKKNTFNDVFTLDFNPDI